MKNLIVALIFFSINVSNILYSQVYFKSELNLSSNKLKSVYAFKLFSENNKTDFYHLRIIEKIQIDSSNRFKNRISGGAGLTPGFDNNWTIYLEYLRHIKNKFYISSSANLYYYLLTLALNGYYNMIQKNSRTDLLFGAGFNVGHFSEEGIKINPQVSLKFDILLNQHNTIGAEIRLPFTLIKGDLKNKLFFMGNVGLNF